MLGDISTSYAVSWRAGLGAALTGLLLTACGGRVSIDPSDDGGGGGGDLATSSTATGGSGGTGGTPTYPDAQTLIEAKCPQLVDESLYCVTLNQYNIVAVSPDTGEVCEIGQVHTGTTKFESIAVLGTELYCCGSKLWRVPLSGGEREDSDVDCAHVVTVGTQLLVSRQYAEPKVAMYASFEDIVAGKFQQEITLESGGGATAFGAEKLWAWGGRAGPNDPVLSFEFPTGVLLNSTVVGSALEYYESARGFDVTDDERIVAVTDWTSLTTIDAKSGELVSIVKPDKFFEQGLHCWSK
jgi:hypothetical protein